MTSTAAAADQPRKFRKGERVYILNCTISGRFFIEGEATVLRAVDDVAQQYVVSFDDGIAVERFIDVEAQDDPAGMVARLNDPQRDPAA